MNGSREHDSDRTQVIFQEGSQVFGRYTLRNCVGQGGMGVVWRAQDDKLEREVALKFLPEQVRRDPEAIRDLKRETNRCLRLTHENIVRVYDFVEDGSHAAISMEYVPGKSLSALKAARPGGCFDVAELLPLVRQLCAALDYAHGMAKIVHRDLKPANLLVTETGVLKVADFGIAKSLVETHTRQTGDLRGASGTLPFMGPQQLLNKPAAAADDIYALGATLYDLLTGKPPFFGGDLFTLIREVPPEPLERRRAELENTGGPIPPEWEETIFACLAKKAEARPATAGEVLKLLEDQRRLSPWHPERLENQGKDGCAESACRARAKAPRYAPPTATGTSRATAGITSASASPSAHGSRSGWIGNALNRPVSGSRGGAGQTQQCAARCWPGFFGWERAVISEKPVHPSGGATLSRPTPTGSARKGEHFARSGEKCSGW